MFKKFRKLTSIIIAALMLSASFASLAQVKVYAAPEAPDYVALGDSVSAGLSATNYYGYPMMLKTYLEEKYNNAGSSVGYQNLSKPGYTTEDLYRLVKNEGKAAIAEADIITVNIGGNNLLQPVIALVMSLYSPVTTVEELNAAIKDNPYPLEIMLQQLQDPASPKSKALNFVLAAGVTRFNIYWPLVAREVRALAPRAEIYVNTLYSPVSKDQAMFMLLNPYIRTINLSIKAHQFRYRYRVVDVYSAFASKTSEVVGFNISGGDINVDIHPNDVGHLLIFDTLKNKMRTTASIY